MDELIFSSPTPNKSHCVRASSISTAEAFRVCYSYTPFTVQGGGGTITGTKHNSRVRWQRAIMDSLQLPSSPLPGCIIVGGF